MCIHFLQWLVHFQTTLVGTSDSSLQSDITTLSITGGTSSYWSNYFSIFDLIFNWLDQWLQLLLLKICMFMSSNHYNNAPVSSDYLVSGTLFVFMESSSDLCAQCITAAWCCVFCRDRASLQKQWVWGRNESEARERAVAEFGVDPNVVVLTQGDYNICAQSQL